MSQATNAIAAQAHIHHAYFIGLQLMVSVNKKPEIVGDWMFRLFRRQHAKKFLSSFKKLGLDGLPDAVACARYHVMSNSIGGVVVEYMYESDDKAWVRFRYPRWLYQGPAICGVPVEVSRGFLNGWYAQNGVSLNNARLGFVCVSEDMTGEFGFCGYFKEYDFDLEEGQRLQFAHGELPPKFKPEEQPQLPSKDWNAARLAKANRNYAIEFVRNGILELANVIGEKETRELAGKAARLIGLQYLSETTQMVGATDGDVEGAARYLSEMFQGMGDRIELVKPGSGDGVELSHSELRIISGLNTRESELILNCWTQLWVGAMASYQVLKKATFNIDGGHISWHISDTVSYHQ